MYLKPVILVRFSYSSLSGGYKRLYEILKRGKSKGIDYIVVTDSKSCENAVKIFPDFMRIIGQYKVFKKEIGGGGVGNSFPILKQLHSYKKNFDLALFTSKIAKKEGANLIVSPGEETPEVITCYFASIFCSRPWTAIFQGTNDLLQPTPELGPINLRNVVKHLNRKKSIKKNSLISKIGLSIELLELLKIAEKSLMLTISRSVSEEMKFLNPKIKFHVINPGNGIDSKVFRYSPKSHIIYDAVFFSRFIPEKGIFDLPKIWQLVVKRHPDAKLAVAGIVENANLVEKFRKMLSYYNLAKNVVFLGPQNSSAIAGLVKSSKLTIHPSILDVFPLVILESLACGTPVVAYDILAIRHAFHGCRAVVRCPVRDCSAMASIILSILENEELRAELSKEAQKYASNFDWENVVKAEKEAYLKVIEWYNSRDKF